MVICRHSVVWPNQGMLFKIAIAKNLPPSGELKGAFNLDWPMLQHF
jgi:hypothetical protein